MIDYITTANSVIPNTDAYNVIIDVVPVKEGLPSDSYLWTYREEFKESKKKIGDITVIKKDGKNIIGLHSVFLNNAGSSVRYKEDEGWMGDSSKEREEYFKSCMKKLNNFFQTKREEIRIFIPLLMTGYYKDTQKRHLSNLEYFIKYVQPYLLEKYNWTVHYKQVRRFKSNNIKQVQLK